MTRKRTQHEKMALPDTHATKDHVIPKVLGGRAWVWACFLCNTLKGDMTPDEWEAWRARHPGWYNADETTKLALKRKNSSALSQRRTRRLAQLSHATALV